MTDEMLQALSSEGLRLWDAYKGKNGDDAYNVRWALRQIAQHRLEIAKIGAKLRSATATLGIVGRGHGLQPPRVEELQRLAAKTFAEIGGRHGP